ncbi:MAG: LysM peptidoglycan-binding domain-containing protein [Rhodospirillales bacterium]|nr:LysM peptidoglycan-binding domain-containing protein [Rhodospirillales bacterium]
MNRPLIVAIIGAIVVIAAIALNFILGGGDEETSPAQTSQQQENAINSSPPASTPISKCVKPSFDVVRINPFGDSVMAGRGAPNGTVKILDDGKPIGEAKADSRGEWVFVPTSALPPGSRQLSLAMIVEGCDKLLSESVVVLVVPESGKDIAGMPSEQEAKALALKVSRDGSKPSQVMQTPSESGDKFSLTVDVVDYDETGRLGVSGHAVPSAKVHVYLNNNHMGGTVSLDNGAWNLISKKTVSPGVYTLRADHVDDSGKVLARVTMPFSKSDFAGELKPGTFIIVKPGHSLWRLAHKKYGSGFNYSVIYEANKEQIDNPDLIYPGQVFTLPD